MNSRRGLPVQVIVSDSGPLISLAACGRLDLLSEFQRPVLVPDVVKAECLRYPEKIGAPELGAWFDGPKSPVEVMATPFLSVWREAVEVEATSPELHPSAGIGDAANAWLLQQLHRGGTGTQRILILTEDGPFGDSVLRDRFPEVHVLSTRAFLRTLENFGRVQSAQAIFDEIAHAGRQLARYMADRPGRPTPPARERPGLTFSRSSSVRCLRSRSPTNPRSIVRLRRCRRSSANQPMVMPALTQMIVLDQVRITIARNQAWGGKGRKYEINQNAGTSIYCRIGKSMI